MRIERVATLPHLPQPDLLRRRHDWVRADVHCILCARLLGRLLGNARQPEDGSRGAGQPVTFLGFLPADPPRRMVPFTPDLRFRCHVCHGAGVLDDIESFSTYDDPQPDEPDHERGSAAAS